MFKMGGYEQMEDKKFCKYCGEKIDIDTIVCPKCGRQLKLVSKPEQEPETEEKMYELKVEEEINVQKTEKTKFYLEKWFMWLMLVFIAPKKATHLSQRFTPAATALTVFVFVFMLVLLITICGLLSFCSVFSFSSCLPQLGQSTASQ